MHPNANQLITKRLAEAGLGNKGTAKLQPTSAYFYAVTEFGKAGKNLTKEIPGFALNFARLQKAVKASLGLSRSQMPVIRQDELKDFAKETGAKLTKMQAVQLKPIQGQIWFDKVVDDIIKNGVPKPGGVVATLTIVVSSDRYILDGHHRWAQAMLANPTLQMKVLLADIPAKALIPTALSFMQDTGTDFREAELDELAMKVERMADALQRWLQKIGIKHRIHKAVDSVYVKVGVPDDDLKPPVMPPAPGEWIEVRVSDHGQARGGGFHKGTGRRMGKSDISVDPSTRTTIAQAKAMIADRFLSLGLRVGAAVR